ncbi:MAG: hypothetical protein GC136_10815 [Alphaproteobacteria bacterium]|nr:hypothetical protein [Alphaproteobacteria bacterium]
MGGGSNIKYKYYVSSSDIEYYWDEFDNLIPQSAFESSPAFAELSSGQKAAIGSALSISSYTVNFSDIINYTFSYDQNASSPLVIGTGDLAGSYQEMPQSGLGFGPDAELGPFAGDVWFDNNQAATFNSLLSKGQFGYWNVLHELGHAFAGLNHSHDVFVNDDVEFDSQQYTIMSYVPAGWYFEEGELLAGDNALYWNDGETPLYAYGLQLFDIAAVQDSYNSVGANTTTRNTNTTYSYGNGLGRDGDYTKAFLYTIWDGGGTDTLDASYFYDVKIDLREGHFSSIGFNGKLENGYAVDGNGDVIREIQNVAIAYGTIIENAKGTAGNDYLIGNNYNNKLEGGYGDDILDGKGGHNELWGGHDNDTYVIDTDYGSWNELNLGSASHTTTETLSIIGDVTGDDIYFLRNIYSSTAHNGGEATYMQIGIYAFDGNGVPISAPAFVHISSDNNMVGDIDVITINGGAALTFDDLPNFAVSMDDVGTGELIIGEDEESNIYGGSGNDIIGANPTDAYPYNNNIDGGGGNDIIYGMSGDDEIDGGDGNDLLFGDLSNGGTGDDIIYGGDGDDAIYGGGGDDILYSGAGNDFLSGGPEDDIYYITSSSAVIADGNGYDIVYYAAGGNLYRREYDLIVESEAGQLVIRGQFGSFAAGGIDVISGLFDISSTEVITVGTDGDDDYNFGTSNW